MRRRRQLHCSPPALSLSVQGRARKAEVTPLLFPYLRSPASITCSSFRRLTRHSLLLLHSIPSQHVVFAANMPPKQTRSGRSGQRPDNLTMTPGFLDSADSSAHPSPTSRRTLPADMPRSQSNASDERTPLLPSAGRSRVRIQSAVEMSKAPTLSRHHSVTGNIASRL